MKAKEIIFETVGDMSDKLIQMSNDIFNNPELGFEEYYASELLSETLKEYGFTVEKPYGGLETSFCGTFNNGDGPVIGILAEYDALEMGHACGHNIIATTAVGAGVSLKKAMIDQNIKGSIKVIGTPAEEFGGGKIILQENNAFEGLDAILLLHPTTGTSKIAGRCKSSHYIDATFTGISSNAISRADQGINATEASVFAYQALASCLKYLPDDVSIIPLISTADTADGLMTSQSIMNITITAFEDDSHTRAIERVKKVIEGAAIATGNEFIIEERRGYKGRVINETIGNLMRDNMILLGEPIMDGLVDDGGFEDFGNLNRVIPGAMVYPSLLREKKISNHTYDFKALCNSQSSHDVLLLGSRVMAYTALDLLLDPNALVSAKNEIG